MKWQCVRSIVRKKIVYDLFAHHKELGGFILIDRVSHMTSACGTIEQRLQREDHVVWQKMDITPQYRAEHMNQKAKDNMVDRIIRCR